MSAPTDNSAWLDELKAFLEAPGSYSPVPDSVVLVQTHGSFAALTGDFVYKVRKPVNFGFLDYSTLERRQHFAHREIELNRRLAPSVYIGVVPIVRRGGRLAFGEPGPANEAVEYAVHMHRLHERWFLSALLARGEAGRTHIQRIVDVLAPFYQSLPPAAGGTRERIREAVIGNLDLCARALELVLPRPTYAALRRHGEQFIDGYAEVFEQRIADGWIRDGHGDLRPIHVHLAPERVSIYDCIEFNDNLRCIDVAADVAFLGMELAFAGQWDLSEEFLSRMGARLGDVGMPRLLPAYLCYRAAVRGKVAWLLAQDREVATRGREAALREARAYFQLALRYALFGARPVVLCVMGRVGTGKSTVASAVGESLGWKVFSSDRVRKELAGIDPHVRAAGAARDRLYSADSTSRTYERLGELAREAMGRQRGVVLDATFGRAELRRRTAELAESMGASVLFVELRAAEEAVRARLGARASRVDVVSDARVEDFEELNQAYEPPTELPAGRIIRLESEGPVEGVIGLLWRQLSA